MPNKSVSVFQKDPENIGWVGGVYIDTATKKILLVKNIKRESLIKDWLNKYNRPHTIRNLLEMEKFLGQSGYLEDIKPNRWELFGGKMPFWAGNTNLQKEFNLLNPEKDVVFMKNMRLKHVSNREQLEFLQKIGWRVLCDEEMLLRSSDQALIDEAVQETGLLIKKADFLLRTNAADKSDPDGFYPRFWYKILIAEGELRTEPEKDTVSPPSWIPLKSLQYKFKKGLGQNQIVVQSAHMPGVYKAVKDFCEEGNSDFEDILKYLNEEFPFAPRIIEETTSWDAFTRNVIPLKQN